MSAAAVRNVARAVFVDTDVFLRFLLRDSEAPYKRARELFELAESGAVKLDTTVTAFAALADELEAYGLGRAEIKDILRAILGTRNLRVQNRLLVAGAVELLGRGMSFRDAYAVAYMKDKGITKTATFRRGGIGTAGEPIWKDTA